MVARAIALGAPKKITILIIAKIRLSANTSLIINNDHYYYDDDACHNENVTLLELCLFFKG